MVLQFGSYFLSYCLNSRNSSTLIIPIHLILVKGGGGTGPKIFLNTFSK